MSSHTLLKILENWKGDPTKEGSPLILPFDIENFCREMDFEMSRRDDEISALKFSIEQIKNHADRALGK